MGASNVDLDSFGGWVQFSLQDPVRLDLAAVADTLESASYELHEAEVVVWGRVVDDAGGRWLVPDGTGQRLHVQPGGSVTVSDEVRSYRAVVLGWHEGVVRLGPLRPAAESDWSIQPLPGGEAF